MRADARRVRQRNKHIVVHHRAGSPSVELRVHVRRRSEQREGLIDQVTSQIKQQSAPFPRVALLAPSTFQSGTPALEPRLEAMNLAERAFTEQTAHRQKI